MAEVLNCAEFEVLLADKLDGALPSSSLAAFEAHAKSCAACAALMNDAREAVAFMERAPRVEAPPELLTKLLFEVSAGPSQKLVKPSWVRRLFGARVEGWLEPIVQPRFAMGMAMTVLSFAMLGKVTGVQVRQLNRSDLDPVKVWMGAEDKAHRLWERGVKSYENLKLVYLIQSTLKEWRDEDPNASPDNAGTGQPPRPEGAGAAKASDGRR
jgi:anti-sigma factor RsiW